MTRRRLWSSICPCRAGLLALFPVVGGRGVVTILKLFGFFFWSTDTRQTFRESTRFTVAVSHHCQKQQTDCWKNNFISEDTKVPLTFQQKNYMKTNKTCRRTRKLACNCAFPLWSIFWSQTWFKSIKGFAETDTVKIKHKKFKVCWP